MAKHTDKFDPFKDSPDLDFDIDTDINDAVVPKDRSPMTEAAKGAAEGALDSVIGEDRRRDLILKALPKEYNSAYREFKQIQFAGRDVYREARQQLRETQRLLKQTGREVLPAIKPFMPNSWYEKLNSLTKDRAYGYWDPQQAEMDSAASSVFGTEESPREEANEELDKKAKDEVDSEVKTLQLSKLYQGVVNIENNTSRMVSYQNTVTTNYRRKMLELAYRQYFAITDLATVIKNTADKMVPAVESIVHNTALPDYAKEEFSEITKAQMKRKIIEKISPANYLSDYWKRNGEGIKGKVKDFIGGLNSAIGMGDMVKGMFESDNPDDMFREEPLSDNDVKANAFRNAAKMAGGVFADNYINPHINKLAEKTRGKLSKVSWIRDLGLNLLQKSKSAGSIINTINRGDVDAAEYGKLGSVIKSLGFLFDQSTGDNTHINMPDVNDLKKPAAWSNRSNHTLNVIIPAILAKIDQSVRRIYDPQASLEQYDFKSLKFTSVSDIAKRVRETIDDDTHKNLVKNRYNAISKYLGVDSLSKDAQESFKRYLDQTVINSTDFNMDILSKNANAFGNIRFNDAEELRSHFESKFSNPTHRKEKNIEVIDALKNIATLRGDRTEKVQEMIDLYGENALINANILQKDGYGGYSINRDLFDNDARVKESTDPEVLKEIMSQVANTSNIQSNKNQRIQPTIDINSVMSKMTEVNSRMVAMGVSEALYGDGKHQTLKSVLKSLKDKKVSEEGQKHVLEPILNEIKAQLVANNVKPELEMVIEGILELMTNTEIMASDQTTLKGIAKNSAIWAFRKGKKLSKLAMHYAGKANKRMGEWYERLSTKIPDLWHHGKKAVTEGFDAAVKTTGSFFDSLLGKLDIYDDQGNIKFAGNWIKEGYYRNENGEPIKSLSDIKGAVYDPKGNVIYTAEQVNEFMTKLRYWTTTGWKTIPMTAGKWAGAILNKLYKGPQAGWDIAKRVGKRVFFEFWTSRDIYVKPDLENPRLTHALMVKGFYVNRDTGEVVRDVMDIHGPIINKYKEVVISEEELKDPHFQLVDVDGKPFKSISDRLMDFLDKAKDMAMSTVRWGINGIGKIKDTVMASWDWLSQYIKSGKAMSLGGFSLSFGGDKTYERINDIYKLLLEKLGDPKKKKKESRKSRTGSSYRSREDGSDDSDGNGIRDNSWKDYYQRRQKERAEKNKDGNAAGSIRDKVKDSAKAGMDLVSGLLSPFTSAAKSMAGAFLGKLTSGIGGVAKKMATGFIAYAKKGLSTVWNYLKKPKKLLGSILKGAGRAIAATARFGLRTILWQGGRMVLGAAVGLLTAPEVIIGAVIAGVSYGAYKLATRKSTPLIDQVRFAQYGTEDYGRADLDDVAKIRFLEDQVLKHTAYDSRGMSMIRGIPANDLAEMQKGWGLDPTAEDKEKIDRWQKWFMGRFVPVYLLWTTRAKQCIPEIKFTEIGDFSKYSPKDAKVLLTKCDLRDNHPIYNVETGPFNDEDLNDGEKVREVFSDVMEKVDEAISDMPETKKADIAKIYEEQVKKGYVGYGMQAQAIPKASLVPRKAPVAKEAVDMGPNGLDHPMTAGSVTTITSTNADDKRRHPGSQINALDAIRLKTYGLISMTYQHIEMIYRLEDLVMPSIIKNGRFWVFSGDLKKLIPSGLTIFGLSQDTMQAAGFNSWFQFRFVPTLVQYVNAVYKYLPNVNPFSIQLESISKYAFDIANETRSAMVTIPGGDKPVSVWMVKYSPWGDDTPVNTDMFGSVQGNMNYLEDMRKQSKLNEQAKQENGIKVTTAKNIKRTTYKGKQYNTSLGEYIMTGKIGGAGGSFQAAQFDTGATVGGSDVDYDYDAAITNGVGPGVGGYYDIKRTTNDTAGMASVIIQAAKLVGLDPTLALNIAMLESYPSLKVKAKAGTSTAKGLFQFVDDTWKGMLAKYGAQYGLPANASPYDPVANALMGAQYVKNGLEAIKRTAGRPATAADAYLMHFMGEGAGPRFLEALNSNPGANAAMMFPTAAASNKDIFFSEGRALSVAGVYALIQQKVRSIRSYAAKYTGADPNPWLKSKDKPTNDPVGNQRPTVPTITNKGVVDGNPFTGGSSVPAYTAKESENAAVAKAVDTAKVSAVKANATPNETAKYTKIAAAVAKETAANDSNSAALAASKEAVDANIVVAQTNKISGVSSIAKAKATEAKQNSDKSYDILLQQLEVQRQRLTALETIASKSGSSINNNTNTTMSNNQESKKASPIVHGDEPISLRRVSG